MKHERASRPARRSGFTLIETVLAMVLGAMVLSGCLSVFLALNNAERAFSARYERTAELDITHTAITRALLALQMEEATNTQVVLEQDAQAQSDEPEPRDRIILETDPSVRADSTGWTPQRFEVVCATPPVPAGLATRAAAWYTAQDQEDSLDFSAMDGSQGVTRGVFELRPAGHRERIMLRLGLIGADDAILEDRGASDELAMDEQPDWTLWWRPILGAEGELLRAGFGPYPDTYGQEDEIRARLAGAVPLLRNIERCIWELYKGDEFITEHYGLTMSGLPAYAQFEVVLTNGQYASWMFEIDWVVGQDPSTEPAAGAATDADGEGDPDDTGGPGGGPGDRPGEGGGRRPGGQIDPDRTRTFDMSGES